ncbi:LuxR family transcriptional regulator [Micromonospora sp. KC721]|uniref:helix-turn-helix transcriptional regulator n=1 Tax=Micromonospora sp. KC721 TaxID=2530380 RepID=UPI00104F6B73|nr:LuxR family transcriptional regulator [Micromonospora sp. KC721]TDB79821.1 LuxR family transcriptional regulator [Micromonospora sp. KC721]
MLHGRAAEIAAIDRLLKGARGGASGALLLRGEAGIGKTALLDHAVGAAADLRVIRGAGIETERQLPFAGLHLLLKSTVERIDGLPDGQARALRAALGLADPAEGDRFLVGMGVLTLLADLAEERPVLCVVDDAHWLDHASADALLFAARRLEAEGVVMLFAAREVHAPAFPAPGVPELTLTGLPPEASALLLAEEAADLPAQVREQILHEAEGNPLALLELPSAQREGQLAAEPYGMRATSMFSRIQQTFADRIASLPEATQTLLLVAAAADGDPASVFAAAKLLGADVADLEPAERQRLLGMAGDRLVFRHPLIRTAAYRGATVSGRLAAHRALADVLDGDRRAWHLAEATTGPDERVAAELERSAESARRRGGDAAVAAAYERAAKISVDQRKRGRRLAAAAKAASDAGQHERAAGLAHDATDLVADPLTTAEMARISAGLADERSSATSARQLLAEAADAVAERAPDLATGLLFAAIETAWSAGDFPAVRTVADQARRLRLPDAARIEAVAVHIGALTAAEGGAADAARAIRLLLDRDLTGDPTGLRTDAKIAWWEILLGDYAAAHRRAVALERESRAQGAIGVLPRALMLLARTQLWLGAHQDARISANEGARIAEDIGHSRELVFHWALLAHLCAIEGNEAECGRFASDMAAHGAAPSHSRATAITALLDLGMGRHEAALEKLLPVAESTNRLVTVHSLPDLVEAAVRAGQPELGRRAAGQYADWADHIAHPWARAIAARCQALLDGAEQTWIRAVDLHHHDADPPFERARTQLLYGEWLRRQHRRTEARTMLRAALQTFERLGAEPWAARSGAELRATGESRPSRIEDADALARLTAQELQVVLLAAKGSSNRDIGTQLFLSPRTVGYHLYNAYPKLGVSSRGELAAVVAGVAALRR